jgi:hypothetical protein
MRGARPRSLSARAERVPIRTPALMPPPPAGLPRSRQAGRASEVIARSPPLARRAAGAERRCHEVAPHREQRHGGGAPGIPGLVLAQHRDPGRGELVGRRRELLGRRGPPLRKAVSAGGHTSGTPPLRPAPGMGLGVRSGSLALPSRGPLRPSSLEVELVVRWNRLRRRRRGCSGGRGRRPRRSRHRHAESGRARERHS